MRAVQPRPSVRLRPWAFVLSVGYALLIVLFPWETITKVPFSDFHDTVEIVDFFHLNGNPTALERYDVSRVTEFFTREIVWHELVRQLTMLTDDSVIALHLISFFILFVWSLFLLRRISHGLALLFLVNPMAIDVAMSGIRNGLAWSFVLIGISLHSRYLRAAVFLIAVSIHTSTLALLIIYYVAQITTSRISGTKTLLGTGLSVGVCVGLALSVFGESVLGAIGDRRAILDISGRTSPIAQASMWGLLLWLQCASGRQYVKQNLWVISVLAWYLTMNLFIPWSFRIWAALLPVIAVSALELPPRNRTIFLSAYSCYLAAQYMYWTKLFYVWYPL